MTDFVMPNHHAIRDMLKFMFGNDLQVTADESAAVDGWHAATYVGETEDLVAVCACDSNFVAYAGAALTMIPADAAQEMLRSGSISDIVISNFHEVMNICSRLMMTDDSPHLRLDKTLLPDAAKGAIGQVGEGSRAGYFQVSIPAYGSGNMAFLIP